MEVLKNKIEEIISSKIRPVLRADNGDIALVEITPDAMVKIRLSGACATCPGAELTLSELVSSELMGACPEVKGVIRVNQVSDDLINQALSILRKKK
ncbi:MAG: NifU family protein [Betaproteobacteria bacterium]